jgi:hypothetical protein
MCRLRQFAGLDKACAVAAGDSHDARGRATATLLRYRCRLPLRWNPLPTRPNMSGRGDLKRTTKRLLVDLVGAGCVALAGNATASLIYTGSLLTVLGGVGSSSTVLTLQSPGNHSSVSGGANNRSQGDDSSISGGINNRAIGRFSSVSGGESNDAIGIYSSVSGGWTVAHLTITTGRPGASSRTSNHIDGDDEPNPAALLRLALAVLVCCRRRKLR